MAEAAQIRDVAKRHAYVFDNGLSSPDFFDVEKRMASEEFGLLRERINPRHSVLEIGCFTGLNLLGLAKLGHEKSLDGIDFVESAVHWCAQNWDTPRHPNLRVGTFPDDFAESYYWSRIICFDVLEHQQNVGLFLKAVHRCMMKESKALFLVPAGREYFDCGHVAFFPDAECLRNVLEYYFQVDELFELKTCRKLFASCTRRT